MLSISGALFLHENRCETFEFLPLSNFACTINKDGYEERLPENSHYSKVSFLHENRRFSQNSRHSPPPSRGLEIGGGCFGIIKTVFGRLTGKL
jgi:hypothetical protein